ncbi:unnamed protein product [Somion occarium]|uniref:Rab3 GTPase-activating protein catalytic subunit n=2 Tax=Somion occarium TaxID=3059160 RepID=A0ABP1DWP2_9APHY
MFLDLPVFHDVYEEDSWPNPVKKLASQLRKPLPGYASSASHLQFSDVVASIPHELETNTGTPELEAFSDPTATTLNDVLTFVLSIVACVRHATTDSDATGVPRHITPLIYTLFLALSHFNRDACRLSQVPFILPRIKGVAVIHEDATEDTLKVEGIATLLSSCLVVPQCEQHDDAETAQESDCPATHQILPVNEGSIAAQAALDLPLDDENSEDDEDSGYKEIVENHAEMSQRVTVPVLDIPFDAHILPGRGLRSCAVLPILAVADSENIEPLLCSILYQRFVWAIDEPVVGFAISEFDPNLQLFLGWIDIQNGNPRVHLCRPVTHVASNPGVGLFDMTDSYSACVLAQFLLGLQSQYDRVKESACQFHLRPFCWRSDHRNDDHELLNGSGNDQSSRVLQWIKSLPQSSKGNIIHGRHTIIPTDNKLEASQDFLAKEDIVSSDEIDNDTYSTFYEESSEALSQYREDVDSKTSYIVASSTSFIIRRRPRLRRDDEFLFSAWHTERNVAMIGQMYQDDEQPDCHEINEMVDLYRSTLQFAWPKEWDILPPQSLQEFVSILANSKSELVTRHEPVIDLQPDLVPLLHARMRTTLPFFLACSTTTIEEELRGQYKCKNLCSPLWVALIQLFYVREDAPDACNLIISQPVINMSRNKAVDMLLHNDEILVRTFLQDLTAECIRRYGQIDLPEHLEMEGVSAAMKAVVASQRVHDVLSKGDQFKSCIFTRALREPTNLNCDTVLTVSADVHYLEQFHLGTHEINKAIPENQQSMSGRLSDPFAIVPNTHSHPSMAGGGKQQFTDTRDVTLDARNPVVWPKIIVKNHENSWDAYTQTVMCCVSAVQYLSAVGIKGYPVFGIYTSGTTGGVIQAWQSASSQRTYVFEHFLKVFDVSRPIYAFWFATSLLRLRASERALLKTNNRIQDNMLSTEDLQSIEWSQKAQSTKLRIVD